MSYRLSNCCDAPVGGYSWHSGGKCTACGRYLFKDWSYPVTEATYEKVTEEWRGVANPEPVTKENQ